MSPVERTRDAPAASSTSRANVNAVSIRARSRPKSPRIAGSVVVLDGARVVVVDHHEQAGRVDRCARPTSAQPEWSAWPSVAVNQIVLIVASTTAAVLVVLGPRSEPTDRPARPGPTEEAAQTCRERRLRPMSAFGGESGVGPEQQLRRSGFRRRRPRLLLRRDGARSRRRDTRPRLPLRRRHDPRSGCARQASSA
jgi:hypothetical protein